MRRPYVVPLPGGRSLALGERTLVMGILNVTPDSFADGGLYADTGRAIEAGLRMVAQGADLLDVGGESTRPGAVAVPVDEEQRRVLPVIAGLARQTSVPISVDTYKAEVAAAAIDCGATIVNDISGLRFDAAMGAVAARHRVGLVLMHTRGRPANMYAQADYTDVVTEVARELQDSIALALEAGVRREAIVLDPGIGFAKRAPHSLELLARLDDPALLALDRPLLVGPSRKSFLRQAIGELPPAERDWATAASVAAAILGGAHILRVHRVEEMVQVARVTDEILKYRR
ncbi:MAG TPA: dihydropteroate synthase [Vicinamibacterales bacterium]